MHGWLHAHILVARYPFLLHQHPKAAPLDMIRHRVFNYSHEAAKIAGFERLSWLLLDPAVVRTSFPLLPSLCSCRMPMPFSDKVEYTT
eukprot:scaffold271604_cov22-Tisochrysis_lutea.AAC.1